MPKISIIIPTYNRDEILKKTLTSLRIQSFKDFEVIICDDGGNSKAEKITYDFNKYLPSRYYWRKNDNCYNSSATKNLGAEHARGDYLLFLDCDIILPPQAIKIMYSWLTKYPYRKDKFHTVPKERINIKTSIPQNIILQNLKGIKKYYTGSIYDISLACTGLISKNVFDKIGGMDGIVFAGVVYGDVELSLRLKGFLNNKIKRMPFSVYHIENDKVWTKREIYARKRGKYVAKALMEDKFKLMGFDLNAKTWDLKKFSKYPSSYYDRLLKNKILMKNISKKVRKNIKIYDKKYGLFNK